MTSQNDRSFEALNARVEEKLKDFDSASTTYRVASAASAAAPPQPYLVFLTNTTGQDLNWQVFYGEVGDPNVEETGRQPIPNQTQNNFRLGGPGDCSRVAAYRLLVDDGNSIVADTGGVAAHQNPNTPCVDAYVIQ